MDRLAASTACRRCAAFLLLPALLAAAGGGCGRGKPAPPAAAGQTAGAPAPLSADEAAAAARLVGHGQLEPLLPAMALWQRSAASGTDTGPPAPSSRALARYTRHDRTLDVEITDTGGNPAMVAPLQQVVGHGLDQRAANGYLRGVTVSGFPALESWNRDQHIGEITVLVANRFIVHVSGSNLDGVETLRRAVNGIDLDKLAALDRRNRP